MTLSVDASHAVDAKTAEMYHDQQMRILSDTDIDYIDAVTIPSLFADALILLRERLGLKILGGCCGTSLSHLRELMKKIQR